MLSAGPGCPREELPQGGHPDKFESGWRLLGGKNPLSIGIGPNHTPHNPTSIAPAYSALHGTQSICASTFATDGPGRVDRARVAISSGGSAAPSAPWKYGSPRLGLELVEVACQCLT